MIRRLACGFAVIVPFATLVGGCSDATIYSACASLDVAVTTPGSNSVYWLGDTVPLAGRVDLGCGGQEGTVATWSVDGTDWTAVATPDEGGNVSAEYTPTDAGLLVVRLVATHERYSGVVEATATFEVRQNEAPEVSILSPADGSVIDSEGEVLLRGLVRDDWDEDVLTTLECTWSSDGLSDNILSSPDGLGFVEVDAPVALAAGTRDVTLCCLDLRDEAGCDAVEVEVIGCTDADADGVTAGAAGAECGGDCDDANPDRFPGNLEVCDGVDNDCDTLSDEDDPDLLDALTWYADHDLDSHGTALEWVLQCDQPPGFVAEGDDCDDDDPDNFPGNTEACDGADNDCNGMPDADLQLEADFDADGWRSCEECDDGEAAAFPGNPEVCDGIDNDCDGAVPADEVDADGDGYLACEECDDSDGLVFPGAPEICDGLVQDCDGTLPADEMDGDGDLQAPCAGDCDDADDANWLGNAEVCDEQDNDCDGDVDEGPPADATDWYLDLDGDGFGDDAQVATDCDAPAGHVPDGGDCDVADSAIYPGAPELCDGMDNDCDGVVPSDEIDGDGDGYIDAGTCGDDCDDGDPAINPGATEICNDTAAIDDDCNGQFVPGEVDSDADGWMECGECDDTEPTVYPGATEVCDNLDNDCDGSVGAEEVDDDGDGYTECDGDCEDVDPGIHPDEPEVWDGIDQDCDSEVDEQVLFTTAEWCLSGTIGGLTVGSAARIVGDIDGDGFADLVVQAYDGNGWGGAWVFLGPGSPWASSSVVSPSTADVFIDGVAEIAGYGGDLNGDGLVDLVFQRRAPVTPNIEHIIYFGRSTWPVTLDLDDADVTMSTPSIDPHGPSNLRRYGDLDNDGYDDLYVPHNWDGKVWIVFGRDDWSALDGQTVDAAVAGTWIPGGGQGVAVSLGGSLDGDEFADLVVAYQYADIDPANTNDNEGVVLAWYGSASASGWGELDPSNPDLRINGSALSARLGRVLDTHGNLDQDAGGTDDLVVSTAHFPADGFWYIPGESSRLTGTHTAAELGVALEFDPFGGGNNPDGVFTGIDATGDGLPDAQLQRASYGGDSWLLAGSAGDWSSSDYVQDQFLVNTTTNQYACASTQLGDDMTGDGVGELLHAGCVTTDYPDGMVCVFEGR